MIPTEALCQKFRERGYKVTPQRRHIFQVLEGNRDHLSAEALYDRVREFMPDMSLATVYNTLRELVDLGEIRELDLGQGKSRYDPETKSHQHITCVSCHDVADVSCDTTCLGLSTAQRQGYDILGADVTFYGLCPRCGEEQEESRPGTALRVWGVSPGA
jgi:Fe2+ or Zn2+ uptake regulation protein